MAYKFSGDGSSSLPKLSSSVSESVYLDQERQFDISTIHKSKGGEGVYSVPTIVLQSLGTLANGNQKQHVSERGWHCWENKYSTGPVEQDCNKANRMDFERFGITEHFSNLAETSDRSFCIISQQEDGHLLHLGPASPSVS